jgi:hypothetical protein
MAMAAFNCGIVYLRNNNKDGCNYMHKALQLGYEPARGIINHYCR